MPKDGQWSSALAQTLPRTQTGGIRHPSQTGHLQRRAPVSTNLTLFTKSGASTIRRKQNNNHQQQNNGKSSGAPVAVPVRTNSRLSHSQSQVSTRSFNLSNRTGVPKHLETIGDLATVRVLQSSAGSGAAAASTAAAAASFPGMESVGSRPRAKSAGAPGSSTTSGGANRYCPVGSRPRYTFTGPPEHIKPLLALKRPRHPLPEDPSSLTAQATPYHSHPAFTLTRQMCDQYRADLAEQKKSEAEQAKIAAMIKKYGQQQTKIGRSVIPQAGDASLTATQRAPTASAPPPPHLPANANSPTFRFPRRIAYDPSDFENFASKSGRGDTFYRPLSVEEHRYIALHKATSGATTKPAGQW